LSGTADLFEAEVPVMVLEPSNIRCSKRCAKPVLPGFRFWNDMVPHVNGDGRQCVIFIVDHLQAVGQGVLTNFISGSLAAGAAAAKAKMRTAATAQESLFIHILERWIGVFSKFERERHEKLRN